MKTYKEFNLELQERVQMIKGGVVGAKLSYNKLMKAYKHLNKVGADFRFKPFGDDFIRKYPDMKGPARTFGRKDLRKLGGAKTSTSIVPSNLKQTSIVGKQSKYEPSTIGSTGDLTKLVSKKTRRMGKVLSDTPEKTIIVGVSWSQKDRLYKKSSRRLTKLVAHDPNEEAKVGDNVIVEFSKPISKTKKWKLIEVIN